MTGGDPPGRYERMVQLHVAGMAKGKAYQSTSPRAVKRATADPRASRLFARPDFARRVSYLVGQARIGAGTPLQVEQPAAATAAPAKAAKTTDIDRDSVVSKLTLALSNAVNPSEIAQVVREILKVMPSVSRETSEDMPDPLAVVRYLCTAGDKRPSDVRKELGGMVWIMGRVQALCSCPPDLLRSAAQTVADTVALREAKRVRR